MSLKDNSPSMSYISASGISVVWNDEIYMVADFHSCKKYIYWNVELPNQFNASNVMPNRSDKQFLVLVNDNGVATEVPNEGIEVYYDGNSVQNIRDRIFGIYDNNEEVGDRFITIEQNIDGIKTSVGKVEADNKKLHEEVSRIEQKADSIDLSVKDIIKEYNDDKETNQLREELNGSIIQLNADLGVFKSEFTDYAKDNQINSEEKVKIDAQKEILNNDKAVVMRHVDTVIAIAIANGLNEDKIALESAKSALELSHTNLINNMTNAISDMIITPTDRTVIVDAFAKYSQRLMSLKNTCDDIVLLGMGGVIIEELARIGIKSNEIVLSVQQIESSFKSDTSVAKIEIGKQMADVSVSLETLERTCKTSFEDGKVDTTEKNLIEEKITALNKEKADIDTLYSSYSKDSYISDSIKSQLVSIYDIYKSKHDGLLSKIRSVISDGFSNDAEKREVDTAFKEYKNALANIETMLKNAIENIGFNKANIELQKAKEELQGQIDEVGKAVGSLEDTMNGAFKDGILTESEKLAIKQNLLTLSSEKSDIDKQYTTIYANVDLIDPYKSALKTSYDNYITSYNSLVKVINDILVKTGIIDSSDRTKLDNTFKDHNTKLGLYTTGATNAVDSIAKKKIEDSEEKTNKKLAEVKITTDSITSKVENIESTTTTIDGKVTAMDTRLKSAEQKITDDSIISTVTNSQTIKDINGNISSNKENISKIDQKADSINLSVQSKVDSKSIISSINMSPESIQINASKVNITGLVTFSNLSTSGQTTINGGNITTGTINANLANIININASNINTGTINISDSLKLKGTGTRYTLMAKDNYAVYDGSETDANRKVVVGFRTVYGGYAPTIMLGYNGTGLHNDNTGATCVTFTHYPMNNNPEKVGESYGSIATRVNTAGNYSALNMYQGGRVRLRSHSYQEFYVENSKKRLQIGNSETGIYHHSDTTPTLKVTSSGVNIVGTLVCEKLSVNSFGGITVDSFVSKGTSYIKDSSGNTKITLASTGNISCSNVSCSGVSSTGSVSSSSSVSGSTVSSSNGGACKLGQYTYVSAPANSNLCGVYVNGAVVNGTSSGNVHITNSSGNYTSVYSTNHKSVFNADLLDFKEDDLNAIDCINQLGVNLENEKCLIYHKKSLQGLNDINKFVAMEDFENYSNTGKYVEMDTTNMVILLVKAIQELKKEVENLKVIGGI